MNVQNKEKRNLREEKFTDGKAHQNVLPLWFVAGMGNAFWNTLEGIDMGKCLESFENMTFLVLHCCIQCRIL